MTFKSFKYLIVLLFVVWPLLIFSQLSNIGYPFVYNYERSDYQAGLQSWMISQADNGLIYFANNSGLLEFDGLNWELYPLKDKSIVRSVLTDKSGRIYAAGGDDFGYFERTAHGSLKFKSLYSLSNIPKEDFEEIWKIYKINETIIFQSYQHIILYKNEKLKVIKAPGVFHFSFLVNDNLYIADNDLGFFMLENEELVFVEGSDFFSGKEITSIVPHSDKLLISTLDNGTFTFNNGIAKKWDTPLFSTLKQNQIYTAIRINDNEIAFGTVHKGLFILSNQGELILQMDETTGIQNNTILSLYIDYNKNLWLGTDNGIDMLKINSPFRQINKHNGISAGYTAAMHNGILYLGTNRGVFYRNIQNHNLNNQSNKKFKLIKATKGQVWSLEVIDNQLFCGHNNGAYLINGTNANKISDEPGVWNFIHSKRNPNRIISGTYTGLVLFEKQGNNWIFSKKIEGFDESSRIMVMDEDENLWMSHVFKGAYHIKLNSDLDKILSVNYYNEEKGFPTDYSINVAKIDNQVVFLTEEGIFEFNKSENQIQRTNQFNKLFDCQNLNYATQMDNNDIWYVCNKQLKVNRYLEDGNYSKISIPFKSLQGKLINIFEFIRTLSDQLVIIGFDSGFIIYNKQYQKEYNQPFNVFLNEVHLSANDSTVLQGKSFKQKNQKLQIDYKNNGIDFYFSAIALENPGKLEFSTYLDGYDNTWSSWRKHNHRGYTDLFEGDYTFYLKARNIYGKESDPITFKFTISPPIYRTTFAYIVYVVIVILFVFIIIMLGLRRIRRFKKREKLRQHQKYKQYEEALKQETILAEKKVIELEKEKLESKIQYRNKELANQTMGIVRKNKFLKKVIEDLNSIQDFIINKKAKEKIYGLKRRINKEIDIKQQSEIFDMYFDEVHEDYFKNLKENFPDLTATDLRVCAFIRMDLTTQEIASILNISYKGAEIRRYRLRKKMDLPRDVNLSSFLSKF
jgi:DNA-binding CsgD family transcriptional regulator